MRRFIFIAIACVVALVACGKAPPPPADAAPTQDEGVAPGARDEGPKGRDDAAGAVADADDPGDVDPASPRERHRRGDRSCARIVTRTRSVASVSGGPMQMIMVTECVPAGK